jgi:hypothetical protein
MVDGQRAFLVRAMGSVPEGRMVTLNGVEWKYNGLTWVKIEKEAPAATEFWVTLLPENGVITSAWKEQYPDIAQQENVHIRIASDVEEIAAGAFEDCENLTFAYNSPNSQLKTIGERAFCGCSNFQGIVNPFGIETIGARAFAGCTALQRFDIPRSVISIGEGAFEGSGIDGITITIKSPLEGCVNSTTIAPQSPLNVETVEGQRAFLVRAMGSVPKWRRVTLNGAVWMYGTRWFLLPTGPSGKSSAPK